jgi:hypothetical protein
MRFARVPDGREQPRPGGSASNFQGGYGAAVAATNDCGRRQRRATAVTEPPWTFDARGGWCVTVRATTSMCRCGREAQLCTRPYRGRRANVKGVECTTARAGALMLVVARSLEMHQLRGRRAHDRCGVLFVTGGERGALWPCRPNGLSLSPHFQNFDDVLGGLCEFEA